MQKVIKGLGQVFILILAGCISCVISSHAEVAKRKELERQQIPVKVSGKVTDEKNQPIQGVSVVEKATNKGTITGDNGQYSLEVNSGSILVFSFIGFNTQEVGVSNLQVINIKLNPDSKSLDELVFVGYQTVRKSDLTGAISSVKAKELNLTTPTLGQSLVGKVAGVQVAQISGAPYSGTKIRVRGIGSINASSEPLYVIDGYPVGGNISSGPSNVAGSTTGLNRSTSGNDIYINPNDIESIEILKDAASAAIYGSRASGGVVLITTKRGKQGKGKLEYEYQAGIHQLAKKVKLLNAEQFASLMIHARNNTYRDLVINSGLQWNDTMFSDNNATRTAKVGNAGSVSILPGIYDYASQTLIQPTVNTDWQDALYRNALVQRHNLLFSGGNNGARYMISGGYQDQNGIIVSTYQKRINLRANIDANLTKKLKVGSSISFTSNNNREVQEGRFNAGPILGALVMMPVFPVYDSSGLALGSASLNPYAFQSIENPVALAQRINIIRKGDRSSYNANVIYEIIPDLAAKLNLGMQTYNEKYEYYYPTSLSSGVNPQGSPQAIAAANATAMNTSMADQLAEFTLNYKKQFGNHRIDALAGYTTQRTTSDIVSVSANGFTNDIVPEITARGANAANFSLNASTTGKSVTTILSYLARVGYNYENKYFLTGSFRTDGSSRFGPANRWGNFPSISGGWSVSNESFYNDWLGQKSTLKLRASWGLSGNNNIGNYRYEQVMGAPTGAVFGNGTVVTANFAGNIADESLGWESTSQYNLGLDAGLLNGRLFVIANYYISNSFNLLFNQSISALSGSSSILTNLRNSKIQNKGFDLQLDGRIITGRNFNLNLSGNITANKNKVLDMGGQSTIFSIGAERTYVTHVTKEGEPVGMYYGFKVAGMVRESDMANIATDNANLLTNNTFPHGYTLKGPPRSSYSTNPLQPGDIYFEDTNGDGIVTEADKQVIGTPYPDFTYGLSLSLNFKGFEFSSSFNGSYGNQVLDGQDYYILNMEASGNQYAKVINRYRTEAQPGDGKIYRASRGGTQSNSTRLSDFYLQDGSFFRCTNMTLGYNFPLNSGITKLGVSSVRMYGSVDNAFTITKYLGYNPEVDYNNGNNLTPGVDYGMYPLVRAISLGAKLIF